MKHKMKHKLLAYAFLPAILGSGLLAVNIASAHGMFGGFTTLTPEEISTRQQTMFQNEATILGISVDDVKAAWAQGKTFQEIITEKGLNQADITTRMKTQRDAQMKAQLQTLVDKGIITRAQADQRLTFMQNRPTKGGMGRGMRMHSEFGF